MDHERWIRRCLELACRGRGRVGTNPMVGAVLVSHDEVLAEGWHEGFGLPHAECMLLKSLEGQHAQRALPHSILYLNLEPCCHHGKTPPCTDLIIERGIKRVAFGMIDPDGRVNGRGIENLRRAGVEVIGPVLPELCKRSNRGYVSLRTKGRPWVTLKRAQTRDGRIAHENGSPLKITTGEQDVWSHTWLRAAHDAILVGVQTIINDDPRLDARLFNPLRVVLDPTLRIQRDARVVTDDQAARTLVIVGEGNGNPKAKEELRKCGVAVLEIPLLGNCFEWSALWEALTGANNSQFSSLRPPQADYGRQAILHSQFRGIASLLVEGGKRTWEGFEQAGFVDEEVVLVGL